MTQNDPGQPAPSAQPPPPSGPTSTFVLEKVVDGKPGAGERRPVTSALLIGRGTVDWPIPLDPKASKYHALFLVRDDKLFVSDLATPNGTAINQNLIRPGEITELQVDDLILIGLTRFRVHRVAVTTKASVSPILEGRSGLDSSPSWVVGLLLTLILVCLVAAIWLSAQLHIIPEPIGQAVRSLGPGVTHPVVSAPAAPVAADPVETPQIDPGAMPSSGEAESTGSTGFEGEAAALSPDATPAEQSSPVGAISAETLPIAPAEPANAGSTPNQIPAE